MVLSHPRVGVAKLLSNDAHGNAAHRQGARIGRAQDMEGLGGH